MGTRGTGRHCRPSATGWTAAFCRTRLPDPYTVADADQWLHSVMARDGKNGIFRAIVVDGQVVGTVSVDQKEDVYRKDADIGYFLVNGLWSRGIMTEAVRQVCDLAFAQLDIVRITGLVYADNMASRRVLEKNGFQEGRPDAGCHLQKGPAA